jgi:hypothetical protein
MEEGGYRFRLTQNIRKENQTLLLPYRYSTNRNAPGRPCSTLGLPPVQVIRKISTENGECASCQLQKPSKKTVASMARTVTFSLNQEHSSTLYSIAVTTVVG